MRRSRRWPAAGRLALVAAAVLIQVGGMRAQAPPAYHALQLDGARFRQAILSTIDLESGRRRSRELSGRDGVLAVRATPADGLISLEAWFDTLTVWREGSGERLAPETDGVIGGRYRGRLDRQGGFTPTDRPFVPEEVAQVSDLGGVLADLLPPLPPVALAPGQSWRDDLAGLTIRRLPDRRDGGLAVERYEVERREEVTERRQLPDSTEVLAGRRETETGILDWSPETGPLRWQRTITAVVEVPAGGPVRQAFRTRIVQQVTTERLSPREAGPQSPRSR